MSYETRQAEHKQTEKHKPSGEPSAGNGQCTPPIMGRLSNPLLE